MSQRKALGGEHSKKGRFVIFLWLRGVILEKERIGVLATSSDSYDMVRVLLRHSACLHPLILCGRPIFYSARFSTFLSRTFSQSSGLLNGAPRRCDSLEKKRSETKQSRILFSCSRSNFIRAGAVSTRTAICNVNRDPFFQMAESIPRFIELACGEVRGWRR